MSAPARSVADLLRYIALAALVLHGARSPAGDTVVEVLDLPTLRIDGLLAKAHTQGLELVANNYYVTARRDDLPPRRALLLRTAPGRTDWDVWDITPENDRNTLARLDHPGGMQSDGQRLWIPVSESKRNGRTMVRVFALDGMVAGHPLKSELEFSVPDHIGALAVSARDRLVLGASWDTEAVYVWNLGGQRQRTLTGADLASRGLGVSTNGTPRAGLAVQDWKFDGKRLVTSGLLPAAISAPDRRSRVVVFERILGPDFQKQMAALPVQPGTELANEGMALSGSEVYFLPHDLGESNRLFRVRLSDYFRPEREAR